MILAPKYLPKLSATIGLFTRYGLREFANRQGLLSLQGTELTTEEIESTDIHEKAAAFRKRLVELGPAYVKLGQVLSTRPDLLPAPYIEELEHLQDDVPRMPQAEVREGIERELGARISKLFAYFEEEPLGSASLGQVHAAQLRDGRDVVVKVQRPNLREQLGEDLEFFRELARFLEAHTGIATRVDIVGVVQQVERALADELDYMNEARNAAMFRRALASFPHILIPRVIEAYSTHKVLTTERIRGVKVDAIPPVSRLDHDFEVLADEFARAYLRQITVDGFFHADPHPGNVFVVLPNRDNPLTPAEWSAETGRLNPREPATAIAALEAEAQRKAPSPAARTDAKLALIDFGMTAHLSEELRDHIVRLLVSIADGRGEEAAETLIEAGEVAEDFDRPAYTRKIATLVAEHGQKAVGDVAEGAVLFEMIDTGYVQGLKLPAELTLLAKALFNLDAITRALDPTFNPADAIRRFTTELANQRARRELSPMRLFRLVTDASDFVMALPRRLDTIVGRAASGDFAVRFDTPQLPTLLEGMQKIANRIFVGLVLAGILVASGLMSTRYPRLAMIGFAITGVVGLYMVLSIVVTDRHKKKK
jgi:predicted unusual protein kinase regulating ubiquinone biosynthesis (AarF/ABC1/UbiB family)